jgi:hypothetical protein
MVGLICFFICMVAFEMARPSIIVRSYFWPSMGVQNGNQREVMRELQKSYLGEYCHTDSTRAGKEPGPTKWCVAEKTHKTLNKS